MKETNCKVFLLRTFSSYSGTVSYSATGTNSSLAWSAVFEIGKKQSFVSLLSLLLNYFMSDFDLLTVVIWNILAHVQYAASLKWRYIYFVVWDKFLYSKMFFVTIPHSIYTLSLYFISHDFDKSTWKALRS